MINDKLSQRRIFYRVKNRRKNDEEYTEVKIIY